MCKRRFLDIDILGPTCQLSLGQERSGEQHRKKTIYSLTNSQFSIILERARSKLLGSLKPKCPRHDPMIFVLFALNNVRQQLHPLFLTSCRRAAATICHRPAPPPWAPKRLAPPSRRQRISSFPYDQHVLTPTAAVQPPDAPTRR